MSGARIKLKPKTAQTRGSQWRLRERVSIIIRPILQSTLDFSVLPLPRSVLYYMPSTYSNIYLIIKSVHFEATIS